MSLGHRALIARVLALVLASRSSPWRAAPRPWPPSLSRPPTPLWLPRPGRCPGRELDAQHAEVERLAERLNATEDNRDRLRVSLRRLQALPKAAQAELDTAQAQLDEQARPTSMQGPLGCSGSWSAGPPARLTPCAGCRCSGPPSRPGPRSSPRSGARKAEVDSLNERVAATSPRPTSSIWCQDDERRQVQHLVEQLQSTLDKIDTQLAGYLEAEQSRAEASRRAAWAGYMSASANWSSPRRAGGQAAVRWALAQLGDPGLRGAPPGPTGSTARADQLGRLAAGVTIPRVPAQWGAGPPAVAEAAPRRPHLLRRQPHCNPASIHHVGMYIGNGLMVHAPR